MCIHVHTHGTCTYVLYALSYVGPLGGGRNTHMTHTCPDIMKVVREMYYSLTGMMYFCPDIGQFCQVKDCYIASSAYIHVCTYM